MESGIPGAPDPDLDQLIERWPRLHPATKLHILSLINQEADPHGY